MLRRVATAAAPPLWRWPSTPTTAILLRAPPQILAAWTPPPILAAFHDDFKYRAPLAVAFLRPYGHEGARQASNKASAKLAAPKSSKSSKSSSSKSSSKSKSICEEFSEEDDPCKKRADPCKKARTPPCKPPKGKWKKWVLLGLLAALITLQGLHHAGLLHPILEKLGLVSTPEFPGLGSPRKKRARHRHPVNPDELPECVSYLVVGGGSAGISAARAIRSMDKSATVLIVAAENAYPYQRPPLSKELWQGGAGACFVASDGSLRSVFYEPEAFYVDCKAMAKGTRGIAVARGWEVDHLNLKTHQAILHDGHTIRYEKCLLATGTSPCTLTMFETAKHDVKKKVLMLHDVCDFEMLRSAVRGGAKDIVIVGSSAEACELASAMARHGHDLNIPGLRITLVYPEETPHGRVLPVYLGRYLARCLENEGVRLVPRAEVRSAASKAGDHAELRLSTGDRVPACRVVVMAANQPNTDLAAKSGLLTDWKNGGFQANAQLFAKDDVWAAGDCVSYCSAQYGRMRSEGLDHALASGRLAGQNMVADAKAKQARKSATQGSVAHGGNGQGNCHPKPKDKLPEPQNYDYMPVRWANLCPGARYEALGEVNTKLPTVGVFAPERDTSDRAPKAVRAHSACDGRTEENSGVDFSRGVVFYLRDNRVVGVLLWNLPRRVAAAREIIDCQTHYEELDDAVRQLCIHA